MIGSKILKESVENIYKGSISVRKNLCSRVRYKNSRCSYCIDICPVNAIQINSDEVKLSDSCVECGACYSACPNAVFRISDKDDLESLSLIKKGFVNSEDRILRIKCDQMKDERKGIFTVPCLGRLTEELILGAFLYYADAVQILKPDCNGCSIGKASSRFLDVYVFSKNLLSALNIDTVRIKLVNSFEDFKEPSIDPDNPLMGRRGFFKSIGTRTISVTEKALKMNKQEEPEGFIYDENKNLKRNLLIGIAGKLYDEDRQALENETLSRPSYVHFGSVSIDASSCTGCGVCVTLCPSGALKAIENEKSYSIHSTRGLCINCGLCTDACKQRAIKVTAPESLKDALGFDIRPAERESMILLKAKRVCPECDQPFYTEDDCCINCRKLREKTDLIHSNILSMEVE